MRVAPWLTARQPLTSHVNVVLTCTVLLLAFTATTVLSLNSTAEEALLKQRVHQLQAEVQELRQTVALLHGGAALVPQRGQLAMPVGQPLIPSTVNIQRTLAIRASLWPHYWTFQSAVTADSKVTVAHILTDRPHGAGNPFYTVLGDASGILTFFTPEGHLVYEHDTGSGHAVTALASNLIRSNTSIVAVGLQDGTILLLAVAHENVRVPDGSGILQVTLMMRSTAAERAGSAANETSAAVHNASFPIRHLFFTKSPQRKVLMSVDASGHVTAQAQNTGRVMLSRKLNATPLAVNLNTDFQMVVQTPHAAFIILMHRGRGSIQRPCAGLIQPQKPAQQQANDGVDLTPVPDSSSSSSSSSDDSPEPVDADCSSSSSRTHVRTCQDQSQSYTVNTDSSSSTLQEDQSGASAVSTDVEVADNKSPSTAAAAAAPAAVQDSNVLVAAVFDAVRQHRVYGVTAGGDLVALGVPSAQKTNLCKVTQRIPLGLPPGPVRLISSKGRLILLHAAGVAAFDVSTQQQPLKLAARHLTSHSWGDMWRLYGLEWRQQQQGQQQQQQEQQQDADQLVKQSTSDSDWILHTAAEFSATPLAAAATANLLLLPMGDKAVAAFSSGPSGVARLSASEGPGSGSSGGGVEGSSVDWIKLLQPLIVVVMVVVAVWQFLRASNKNAHLRHRRRDPDDLFGRSGFSGAGLEGLGPGELGQLGVSPGVLAGGGGLSGLGRRFDDYDDRTGFRGDRHQSTRMNDGLLDMGYGGLNAVNARRRARQVMHGRAGRQQQQQRGSGRQLGSGFSGGNGSGGLTSRQQQSGGMPGRSTQRQQQQQLSSVIESDLLIVDPDEVHDDEGQNAEQLTELHPAQKRVRFAGDENHHDHSDCDYADGQYCEPSESAMLESDLLTAENEMQPLNEPAATAASEESIMFASSSDEVQPAAVVSNDSTALS